MRRRTPGPGFGHATRAVALALALAAPSAAHAIVAPYKGAGEVAVGDDGNASAARGKALAKARKAALEAALAEITGPVDKAAKKAVLKSADAWTGAYRVLAERTEAGKVVLEVEVDVDVARLRKRLTQAPSVGSQPLYRVEAIDVGDGCGDERSIGTRVEDELEAGGATAKDGAPVRLRVECKALGAVPHTFLHAARVELVAEADGRPIAKIDHDGFAADVPASLATAVSEAAGELAGKLAVHRRGTVAVRVEAALPAARVRRLERALEQSVVGVARVELTRVHPGGSIVLRVHGQLDAAALGQALEQLQTPGLRAFVIALEGPDALAIRLQ
jgi:hypothetical protein